MPIEQLWYEIQMFMEGEIWKEAVGYEGYYRVSNYGRVFSIHTNSYLMPTDNGNGYMKVTLNLDGCAKVKYIHRLVAEAFVPNPKGCREVDHISSDKRDNRACNLRWATRQENMRNPMSLAKKDVNRYQITYNDGLIEYYNTPELLERLNINCASTLYTYIKIGFPEKYNVHSCIKTKVKYYDYA